jgi:hypothetical protein
MTHRDPTDVMVSVAEVYQEVRRQFSDDLDLPYLGQLNVEHWSTGMDRLLAFRPSRDDRFFDIDFRAMQADPLREVRALYDWLEPVSDVFERGMKRWWTTTSSARRTSNPTRHC